MVAYLAVILMSVRLRPCISMLTTCSNVPRERFYLLDIVRVVTSKERLRGVFATLVFAHLFLLVMNPDLILKPDVRSYVEGAPFLGDGNDFALSLCILLAMTVELALARVPELEGQPHGQYS